MKKAPPPVRLRGFTGVVLVRRPVGRGILVGTVLAALLVVAGLLAEVLVNSS
jgi:hypothetical protein